MQSSPNNSVEEEKNKLIIKSVSVKDKDRVRVTKTQYNKEIDAAVKRVRNGKSVSNDKVMTDIEKW